MKILILFAHPAFQKSVINRKLVEDLDSMNGVTFHDLYECYPEFDINVRQEQELVIEHDCIIFHHPMFWYSTPAILKEWQDMVLEHGWAYGSEGTALEGKLFFNVVTMGGLEKSYHYSGLHKNTIQDFLLPISQSARLCRMTNLPPFIVPGTHAIVATELKQYQSNYYRILQCIINDEFNIYKANELDYLNHYPL